MRLAPKWFLLLLVGLLSVVFAGCGGSEPAAQNAPSETGGGSASPPAEAEASKENEQQFYDGKTVTMIVATQPGGGYDQYARLLAPVMEKYLPGSTIIVKNVPGAGHIIGANEIYNAEPDGLTFGTFNKGLITSQIVGFEGIKFDLRKMNWLGSPATEPRLFVVSKTAPFKSIDDVIKGEETLIMAAAGVGSSAHSDSLVLAEILGLTNLKVINGYEGQEGELAMLRGEVHAQIGSVDSMLPLIEAGDAHPILIIGNKPLEEFPGVPLVYDYSRPEVEPLIDLMVSQALISRPFAATPGIPEERFAVLYEAFEKAWNDPELISEAERTGRPLEFLPGKEVSEIVKGAIEQPAHVVDLLKEIVKPD